MARCTIVWIISTLTKTMAEFTCLEHVNSAMVFGIGDIVCTTGDFHGFVSDHKGITGLQLASSRIKQIKVDSFKGLLYLEHLNLAQNSISSLDLGVFDETPNMKSLNISYNSLKSLPLGIFDQMPNLEVLDLRGNEVRNIEKGLFALLRKLRHLDLSSNFLIGRDISPDIFENNKVIRFMDFSRNDLSDAPENLLTTFSQIDFLNLHRCFLNDVPAFATKNNLGTMKHLMLSTNQITKLDNPTIFINLVNLEIINLAENVIESISDNIFQPLKQLKVIVLRNNNLKSIPDTLFRNLPKLGNLDLQHNSLEFLPVNAFRNSGIKNLNVGANKITYLVDNFCLELKNSGTNLKKFMFSNNPWQCPCLFDVLAEVKRLEIEYNPDKYDGKTKVCVMQDQYCHRHLEFNSVYVDLYQELVAISYFKDLD